MNTKTNFRSRPCGQTDKRPTAQAGRCLLLCLCLAADQAASQNYTVLHRFDGTDGMYPSARLVSAGTTLYGTASSGGVSNVGTLFSLNHDGTGFTVLKHFTGSDGANPYGGLLLSLIGICFLARPLVLDATRVKEN